MTLGGLDLCRKITTLKTNKCRLLLGPVILAGLLLGLGGDGCQAINCLLHTEICICYLMINYDLYAKNNPTGVTFSPKKEKIKTTYSGIFSTKMLGNLFPSTPKLTSEEY